MRTAIIHKKVRKVILCYMDYSTREMAIICVIYFDYLIIRVSCESDKWLINAYNHDGSEAGFMFADYIQKGNY